MRKVGPKHNLAVFRDACGKGQTRVVVFSNALATAKSDLGLTTQDAVLDFIASDEPENFSFLNCVPLDWWKGAPPPPLVDAYSFDARGSYYLAFFYNNEVKKWIIKSLKASNSLSSGSSSQSNRFPGMRS